MCLCEIDVVSLVLCHLYVFVHIKVHVHMGTCMCGHEYASKSEYVYTIGYLKAR